VRQRLRGRRRLYKSRDGGDHWSGPFGRDAFYDRAAGSIAIRPATRRSCFVASGRASAGSRTSAAAGRRDHPGAPHFGCYRSLDGGNTWQIVNQGAPVLCTGVSPDAVALNQTRALRAAPAG
jgi:hypothetical protein